MTGVVVDHDGARETYTADLVVVSCGAANSARLLLASANDAHPRGLANGSDQVGRNYMFHNCTAVLALSKEPNPTVFQKTLGLNDFYFGTDDVDYPLGNIQMVGKSVAEMYRGEKPLQTKLAPDWTLEKVADARRRLLAVDRGPAAAREPRDPARRRQHRARLHRDQRRAQEAPPARAQGAAQAPRDARRPPAAAPRLPQERHPGRRLRPSGGHLPLRHRSRDLRPRPSTAGRTRSTTSTSSTRASSRASGRSTRRSPRWPTPCASAITCSSAWAPGRRDRRPPMSVDLTDGQHHVVIVGGGFAGVGAAQAPRAPRRRPCHADRPQQLPPVPAAALPGRDVPAGSERHRLLAAQALLATTSTSSVKLAEVASIDPATRTVTTADGEQLHRRRARPRRRLAAQLLPDQGRRGARVPALLASTTPSACARGSSASSRTPIATPA